MYSDPNLGSAGERRYSRHKCGQAFLWAEVYILAGPGVVAADQTRCLAGMSMACNSRARLAGGFCVWAALRWMVCGSGCAGVAVLWVTSMWARRGRMMSIPISTGGDSRPMITIKVALPLSSPHCRFRCWVFPAIWSGLPCAPWTTTSKGFKGPHWVWYCQTLRIPYRSLMRQYRQDRGLGCPRG